MPSQRSTYLTLMMPRKESLYLLRTSEEIQQECMSIDDEARWLVALISDTGMRLSEAAGLHVDDIKLDCEIPHIDLKPHAWRGLKTRGSQRQIPLVGASLWAAKRVKATILLVHMPSPDTHQLKALTLTQHQQQSTSGLSLEYQKGV